MLISLIALVSAVGGGCAGRRPGGGNGTRTEAERLIVGEWRGTAPCVGGITFRSDGTYERRHYSPGDYRAAGRWRLRRDTSPPTLSMTLDESDDPDAVREPFNLTLVRVDADELVYRFGGDASFRYVREVTAAQQR